MRLAGVDGLQGRAEPCGRGRRRAQDPRRGTDMTETAPQSEPSTSLPQLEDVEEAMRDVVDPELGINVVDLGLVYDMTVTDEAIAKLDMTLTSAACPLQDVIEDQARAALVSSGLCTDLEINWVWLPPWGPEKITDDGREQLRALGFTV
ncbi:metal-sulfur cluster assembly factor [Gordonia araii NBRC 100433]|nr:metal-sulfur cluster assembly factor [Gordonia araii NBRC 100433]